MHLEAIKRAALGAVLATAAGCAPSSSPPRSGVAASPARVAPTAEEPAVKRLYRFLIGRYDSAAQAAADPEYRVIHLTSCAVDSPEIGEYVLYVEQAAAEALGRPYRQRLYLIEAGATAGSVRSRVFELRAPEAAVGTCGRGERARFGAADAIERAGCAVDLAWSGGERAFLGSTSGHECPSGLRGASYATSEVRLEAGRLVSWDRGYDAAGAQVWGATKGPYEFVRRGGPPP